MDNWKLPPLPFTRYADLLTSFFYYIRRCVAKIEGDSLTIVRVTSMPTSASPKTQKGFDYASLDAATFQFVQQHTGEIRVLMKRTIESIFEIGQRLIAVKERLGHGRFGLWLAAEFEWSQDTANNFINVAKRFGQNPKISDFDMAASALYVLAAPSTPEAARSEALTRAKAGESITYTAAKAIKQKHTPVPSKPKRESQPEPKPELKSVSQSPPTPISVPLLQSRPKQEIIAIRPKAQATAFSETNRASVSQTALAPQVVPQLPVSAPEQPEAWWQLSGRHLLYCGDPNSPEFLERIPEKVPLLLAFPPTSTWQPSIASEVAIKIGDYLPVLQDPDRLDEALESAILLYSHLGDMVVSCFLPSPEILSVINRQNRRCLVIEPDSRRVNAVISDWKKAGLKVERVN